MTGMGFLDAELHDDGGVDLLTLVVVLHMWSRMFKARRCGWRFNVIVVQANIGEDEVWRPEELQHGWWRGSLLKMIMRTHQGLEETL